MNGISQGYFVMRLKILKKYFEQLVKTPKPYADLNESERKVFQCMKRWMEPAKVTALKRDYDAFVQKNCHKKGSGGNTYKNM
jgi:hypothetical protein